MRIEQGVKIASGSVSVVEDFNEGEIIIVEHINDIEEMYIIKKIINGATVFHPVAFDIFRKSMVPKIKNPDLYYDTICDCYDLETALRIAKHLNDDLRGGE